MERKIIQLTAIKESTEHQAALFVLCNDGTLWQRDTTGENLSWYELDIDKILKEPTNEKEKNNTRLC